MNKWIKILAAAGCCALLCPVTALAGWEQVDGVWIYTHSNGMRGSSEIITEGEDRYYVDDMGRMAVDQTIWLNGDFYYADEEGRLARNQWKQLRNNDGVTCWYYFSDSAKAVKKDSSNVLKDIGGTKYIFNGDGELQYGWVTRDGERVDLEEEPLGWQEAMYYCGTEDEGFVHTGWVQMSVKYESTSRRTNDGPIDYEEEELKEEEDQYKDQKKWFYFRDNGLKYNSSSSLYQKNADGEEYAYKFDSYGVLKSSKKTSKTETKKSTTKYIDPVWEEVRPTYSESRDNNYDYEYNVIRFKYKKKDKKYAKNELMKINGKYYLFDGNGIMREGLFAIKGMSVGNSPQVIGTDCFCLYNDDPNPDYQYQSSFEDLISYADEGYKIMYFTPGKGSNATGSVNIRLGDDNPYTLKFNSSGVGLNGLDGGKLYHGGVLIKSDGGTIEYDYRGTTYLVNKKGKVVTEPEED